MTAREINLLSSQPDVSSAKKRKLMRKHNQYRKMIKTHLQNLLTKREKIPSTICKVLIRLMTRKIVNRTLQKATKGLSGLKRLLTSIGIKKLLQNVFKSWTLLRRIAKTPKSKQNFLQLNECSILKVTKTLEHILKIGLWRNVTPLSTAICKSKDLVSNLMSLEHHLRKVLKPWNMFRAPFNLVSLNSKKAVHRAFACCMTKVMADLTFEKICSRGVQCIVGVSTWAAVSLAIPILVYSYRLANSETTKRLLTVCLQNASTLFERLTRPVVDRVSSYLHDLSPMTLSILSLVVPLLMTAPIRIAKSPLTHQLIKIAVNEVIVPGVLCIGKLAVRALTCSTTRCIISSTARHIAAQVYPVLISTTLALFMSSTARNAIRNGITAVLNLPKSPYFGKVTKEILYSLSSLVAQVVEVPVSHATLCLNLKGLSVERLLTLTSSFIPVQVLFDIVGSLHTASIDLKNQTMDGFLVPILSSSKRVSNEIQSVSFSSIQAIYRSLHLIYSLCLLPKALMNGRKENVATILHDFNIQSIEDLTKPEVLTTCVELVQNMMRPEVRVLLSSAVREMMPQSLRSLLSTENFVQPLCDAQSEPAGHIVYLQAMIYSVLEVLMMPAVQKVLLPVVRDVIVPTVRAISSPSVHSIITNSRGFRYFLPGARIKRLLSSSERVQHYLMSSSRVQMIMAPTYEIKSALITAKDCLELYAKTIKQ